MSMSPENKQNNIKRMISQITWGQARGNALPQTPCSKYFAVQDEIYAKRIDTCGNQNLDLIFGQTRKS